MSIWLGAAFWQGINPVTEIVRNFQLIAKQDHLLPIIIIFLGTAAVLAVLAPRQRARIRTALLMFSLALVLMFISAVPAALGWLSAARVLHGAGLLLAGFGGVKLGSIIVFDVILGLTPFSPPQVVRDLLVAAGYLGTTLWLFSSWGVTLTSLVATSAVVTAVVVFSLQDSLSSILGGLVLQIDKSVSVGDWVKVDQTSGLVKEITWRHTAIETRNWDTVIIPNSVLIKSQVLIQGRRTGAPAQQRRQIYFNVDFRVPPTEVMRVVTDALVTEPVEGAALEPPPNCILMEFKESSCQYAARYWLTNLAKDDPTDSLVRSRIYFALERAGLSLSLPAYTTFVEQQDLERERLQHERELAQRMSALARVELLRELNEEERRKLAERLRIARFMKGELMTRQGAEAHWLYILTQGSAEVIVSADAGVHKQVNVLQAGDFFGEMSLLTGEPRSASLRALEDSECYRLDRQEFEDILRGRPAIAQYLSELLARRKVENEAVRQDLDAEAQARMMQNQQKSIFASIHKLFGLGNTTPKSAR